MIRSVLATLTALALALFPQENQSGEAPRSPDQPTSQPAIRTSPRNPQQARIYEALLRDTAQERVPVILSQQPEAPGGTGQAVGEGGSQLVPESKVVSELTGRLVRTGDRSEFQFTAGGPGGGAQEVVEFNKNGLLELMEVESEAGVKEFIVTVEFTVYRGRNYLNLLKFRRQPAHGNLSP